MESSSVWTDEKHLHYLNNMEASFVRTMLHRYAVVSPQPLRLDRYLPDSSESTLDSKPNRTRTRTRTRPKKHAPSPDSMVPRGRRTKKRSSHSQLRNSSTDQVDSQVENERESGACVVGGGDKEPTLPL
ncbi:hypothetical protein VNO78_19520 [Psophocarpus tetragonolobus]|uniref:Uncharacterized protein n=1 Tax=Psophocarpus tetragonolobus TaxID=3891 RepID=A0AAN9XGC3_PSOTE